MITVMSDWADVTFMETHKASKAYPTFTTKDGVPAVLSCPYLHYGAEDLAGYDIVAFTGDTVVEDKPEQPCKLLLEGGTVHACILVMWNAPMDMPDLWRGPGDVPPGEIVWTNTKVEPWTWALRYRGLICLTEDEEALTDARAKCAEKVSCM